VPNGIGAGRNTYRPKRSAQQAVVEVEEVLFHGPPYVVDADLPDDLVILCRRGKAEETLRRMREIMGKLKLTVKEEKTRFSSNFRKIMI
jgi:hypothetical protein